MFKNLIYGFVLLAATGFSNGIALADEMPTLDQVYQTAHAGKLDEAQRMMDIVLKAHPNSAKAHFVEAELLAKQGQMGRANEELNNAQHLKPDLSFANPQAVQDLKNRIAASHPASQSSAYRAEPVNSFPWGMLLLGVGAIAVIVLVIRAMNSRNQANFPGNYQPGMQNSPMPASPYGGGMGPGGSYGAGPVGSGGGGMAGGIMGGLATGAAVGVGMVAGEALAHHFMDGGHNAANSTPPVADAWGNSNNMGGSDFGIADNSSWDDSSSVADNGGGDWG
ncbi:MAG: tetratricopeptide repeat protein [Proteobacteria bacterium]|nr:tetratricopeptide repeat protein [Pseudomonadota bacterium]